ncbi:ATP-binding cassette domain-containing protein [Pseudogemmobacter sp. W21_MBD1_M6]|uniref:ATP-binding cassette domain-containing protein n=1 Tax=Pseudogemmobacter sp. W21_MBD1_M6 TaxID=3240271 RepID=UPI003F9DD5D9
MFDTEPQLTPSPCSLRVEGVRLLSGDRVLLDGIDLTLGTDARTCLMGFNGAGKSLLLRCLHGLIAPSAGRIVWAQGAGREAQAMVFQKPVLLRRNAAQNIAFAAGLRGKAGADLTRHLLDQVGLLDKAETPAQVLSGGEKQRLALARALALRPRVLFLDEATANLDPLSVRLFEDTMNAVHKAGTKIIFVSHDPAQARRMADEIVFLHNGRITEVTRAAPFFAKPQSAAARAYLAGDLFP